MYAGDFAKIIKYCVETDVTESFNIAPEENLSIRQFAETALKAVGLEHLRIVFDQSSPDGQFRKDVSNARMKQIIGDFPLTPLAEGIKKVYQFYKTNKII